LARQTKPPAPPSLLYKPCCTRVCKPGGAGGFACRANLSHLLTLGAIWQVLRPAKDPALDQIRQDLVSNAGSQPGAVVLDAEPDQLRDFRSGNWLADQFGPVQLNLHGLERVATGGVVGIHANVFGLAHLNIPQLFAQLSREAVQRRLARLLATSR